MEWTTTVEQGAARGPDGAQARDVGPILLFDGACGSCTRIVRFVLARDHRRRSLRFAPLGGETAGRLRERHPELAGVDSMIWVETAVDGESRPQVRTAAVLALGRYLGGGWSFLAGLLAVVPTGWRDAGYDAFARIRAGIPGLRGACTLPDATEPGRFLP